MFDFNRSSIKKSANECSGTNISTFSVTTALFINFETSMRWLNERPDEREEPPLRPRGEYPPAERGA
jgi:hypothetical protein